MSERRQTSVNAEVNVDVEDVRASVGKGRPCSNKYGAEASRERRRSRKEAAKNKFASARGGGRSEMG